MMMTFTILSLVVVNLSVIPLNNAVLIFIPREEVFLFPKVLSWSLYYCSTLIATDELAQISIGLLPAL